MNEINSDVPMVLKLIQIIKDKLSVGTSILQFLEFTIRVSQFWLVVGWLESRYVYFM